MFLWCSMLRYTMFLRSFIVAAAHMWWKRNYFVIRNPTLLRVEML